MQFIIQHWHDIRTLNVHIATNYHACFHVCKVVIPLVKSALVTVCIEHSHNKVGLTLSRSEHKYACRIEENRKGKQRLLKMTRWTEQYW